ncbi:MAG: class I SAM-dependent methyltransferase [Patescibacteria group bacterium]
MSESQWNKYYEVTKEKPPQPLVVEAIKHVTNIGAAIDLGAGMLRHSKFLQSQGFEVIAVDKDSTFAEAIVALENKHIHGYVSTFEDFDFPTQTYDFVCAMSALPFVSPDNFTEVFTKVVHSLKPGGIFCGNFFGLKDSWNNGSTMTFLTRDQINAMFKDFEIIYMHENDGDITTVTGEEKHSNRFHIIARKK